MIREVRMASEWDKIVDALQKELWAGYPEIVMDHAMNPRNLGRIERSDGFGRVTGPCGDTMEVWLKMKGDVIHAASFWTDGCGATIAAGSMVTELAKGKTIREVMAISERNVLDALGGLPQESRHCALLAADTLREAVKNYLTCKQEPWKRVYQNGQAIKREDVQD
jgi:nitrogen fixation NifU-like protein